MDTVEKKLIEYIHSSKENLENATYCNQLTSELLEIIKLQHKGTKFKGTDYKNKHTLHINMAKYYVKAFQVFYAINKVKLLVSIMEIDSSICKDTLLDPKTHEDVAYNCIYHIKKMHDVSKTLNTIIDKLINNETFLPSLEEMDKIVKETKINIKTIELNLLIKNYELFLEKIKFNDFTKIFSNL